jgi:hypothetical protein
MDRDVLFVEQLRKTVARRPHDRGNEKAMVSKSDSCNGHIYPEGVRSVVVIAKVGASRDETFTNKKVAFLYAPL